MTTVAAFRAGGRLPELWWPDSGRIERPAVYDAADGRCACAHSRAERLGVRRLPPGKTGFDPVLSVTRDGQSVFRHSPHSRKSPSKRPSTVSWAIRTARGCAGKSPGARGQRRIHVSRRRLAEGDDPAYGIVKTLVVEYRIGSQALKATGQDPETITFLASSAGIPIRVCRDAAGTSRSKPGSRAATN